MASDIDYGQCWDWDHPTNWATALKRGHAKFSNEVPLEVASERDGLDDSHYFRNAVADVQRAQELYREIMAPVEVEYRQRRQQALNEIADRLEAEGRGKDNSLPSWLRNDRPDALTDW